MDGDYDDAEKAQESIWIYANFVDGTVQFRFDRQGREQEALISNKADSFKELNGEQQIRIQMREKGYAVCLNKH